MSAAPKAKRARAKRAEPATPAEVPPVPAAAPKAKRARAKRAEPVEPSTPSPVATTNSAAPFFRVSLSDYRCWSDTHTWTFPLVKGLVLIHAPSGSGKSSILQGITWGLTGKTAANSATWGKKKMTCDLEWNPHHPVLTELRSIYRCNTPKTFRLIFVDGSKKENAEAEAWIAEQIHPKAGELSGLPQKLNGVFEHFLRMNQSDKSLFLQQLLLGSGQDDEMAMVSKLREFCKQQTQSSKTTLDKSTGSIESIEKMISDMTLGSEPSAAGSEESKSSIDLAEEIRGLELAKRSWENSRKARDRHQQAVQALSTVWQKSDEYTQFRMVEFKEWVKDWTDKTEVSDLINELRAILDEEIHTVNSIEYETAVAGEISSKQKQLDNAQVALGKITVNIDSVDIITKQIHQDEQYLFAAKTYQKELYQAECMLNADRVICGSDQDLQHKLETLEKKRIPTQCPSCRSIIEFDMKEQQWTVSEQSGSDSATEFDGKKFVSFWFDRDIVKKNWNERQELLAKESRASSLLQDTKEIAEAQNRMSKNKLVLNQIEEAKQSVSRAQQELNDCKNTKLLEKLPSVARWAKLPRNLALPEEQRATLESHRKGVEGYTAICVRAQDVLESLNSNISSMNILEFSEELENTLSRLRMLASNAKLTEQLAGWKDSLEKSKRDSRQAQTTLESSALLEKMVRQAELQVVESHLFPVNSILQQILDDVMFQDGNEIQCKFLVLAVGSKKPELAMDLLNRGQPCDEKSLSGGEYDRLALAVTMTFYRLFASKLSLLCLDETLGALDSDKASEILEVLHENANVFMPGLTLMVDHHGSRGHFDFVLEL